MLKFTFFLLIYNNRLECCKTQVNKALVSIKRNFKKLPINPFLRFKVNFFYLNKRSHLNHGNGKRNKNWKSVDELNFSKIWYLMSKMNYFINIRIFQINIFMVLYFFYKFPEKKYFLNFKVLFIFIVLSFITLMLVL